MYKCQKRKSCYQGYEKTAFAIIMNLEVVHEAIQDVGSTGYKQ